MRTGFVKRTACRVSPTTLRQRGLTGKTSVEQGAQSVDVRALTDQVPLVAACSGAIKAGVPSRPVLVIPPARREACRRSSSRARPKSAMRASPCSSSKDVAGLEDEVHHTLSWV